MGIFSNSSPFDPIIEKATLETNTKEDWALILDICDRVGSSPQAPKECLRSIIKRLNNQDPHVAIQAVTLLDACVNNCGLPFHLEIASRDFEQEYQRILSRTKERAIREKLLGCLQKWALNEFRSDPQLDLIPSLYNKLKSSGFEFPADTGSPSKSKKAQSHRGKDHASSSSNPSAAQQEADDLAKAIELSLKETQKTPQGRSLYPQVGSANGGSTSASIGAVKTEKEPRKVRALYDFEAAEDNELTFYAGEIVHITDDSDSNWWEGTNQRGKGLFPSNFVTADLSAEPPKLEPVSKKQVQFAEEVTVKSVEVEPAVVEIDEAKIDQTLELLHNADPTGEQPDLAELETLEDQVQQMGPLIDQELERIDRSHAQLTRLGSELVDALNMYHNLMRGQTMMAGPPGSAFPPHLMNKLPVSGPASVPNFPTTGMPQGMHPGFSHYFDPAMMAQQQMRPPQSAPAAPNSYHGMPQNSIMGPQMNGMPGQVGGPQMPSMPMQHQNHQQGGPHQFQQQMMSPPMSQQLQHQPVPGQMPAGHPPPNPGGPMPTNQPGMQQMQPNQMAPQPNMNQVQMPGPPQHPAYHQMNPMPPPGVLPPQGY